jgi:uncharacterized protein (TIGR03067 family)
MKGLSSRNHFDEQSDDCSRIHPAPARNFICWQNHRELGKMPLLLQERLPMLLKAIASAAIVFFVSLPSLAADAKTDNFDGTWTIVSAEMAGQKMPEEMTKSVKLVIKGDTYAVTAGEETEKGTSKADASAKPKKLDITASDGANKGKTIQAIYELDGDTMRVCYDVSGKTRPTEFKSAPGTTTFLVTYKREKAEAK